MSNPKRYPGGTGATYWGKIGKTNPVRCLISNDARIPLEELPAFIAWLQEGPPKPKWRITREFDEKPGVITFYTGNTIDTYNLTDDDVEEVEQ
jgi:hypothetical protein